MSRPQHSLHGNALNSASTQSQTQYPKSPTKTNPSRFAYNPGTQKAWDHQARSPISPTRSSYQVQKHRQIQGQSKFDPEKEFRDTLRPMGPSRRSQAQSQVQGQGAIALGHAPPIVQGIPLIPVNRLPDRLRQIFPFELFNAIQSKTFEVVYESNDNVVVSAPTGSGKTALMELAICKLIASTEQGSYKVIYQAPTKALCSEKKRDWDKKFAALGLVITELTGDTDFHQISHVKNGDIIITTPEKWDSMTRRWQDHQKLMKLVKLFLVDEVHMLKDQRGATLEVVITRMKSIGADVRFIALSATVPNSQDIALWLGKNCAYPNSPAYEARFDEEFRPVKLQKYVYGYNGAMNDFMFDKSLDKMLPDLIKRHSSRKPIIIFCMTRQICQATAKSLAEHWLKREHLWPATTTGFSFRDKDLQSTALCGVAFHHAGLDQNDRLLVEKLFLEGILFVICSTSTLAVGINLPAYMVILKNTLTFSESRLREYDDLEVMQMLGRAGRPQFDTSGIAVIMTKNEMKNKYERLISGSEIVESCLHENLVEHLNAEIWMGTISEVSAAKLWLKSTFLWVRMKRNPTHYKIEGQTIVLDIEQKLDEICEKDIRSLQEYDLVFQNQEGRLKCTPSGIAMATYYIKLETMKRLLSLDKAPSIAEILMTISEAQEFKELRMRVNERAVFREINKSLGMKYPIKGDVSTTAHKVYTLIQFDLGSMEFPQGDSYQKYNSTLIQEKNFVFQHVHRIIRCLIDCLTETKDATALKSALLLARCFSAKCWENSPNQLRQLESIGPVTVKKFAMANIRTLESLATLEPHKIEMIASRNPPFGTNILNALGNIPVFSLTVMQLSNTSNKKDPVKVVCKADIGYTNKQVPSRFNGSMIIAYFLAECDGHLLDFRRIPAFKLEGGKDIIFTAEVSNPDQKIICYISCESIVGTLKSFELKPDVDPSLFPPPPPPPPPPPEHLVHNPNGKQVTKERSKHSQTFVTANDVNDKQQSEAASQLWKKPTGDDDDDEYDDGYFAAAVRDLDFTTIDGLSNVLGKETESNASLNARPRRTSTCLTVDETEAAEEPVQLPNGNWACKHKCGDKTKCKHICCREGLEKPPKIAKRKVGATQEPAPQTQYLPLAALSGQKRKHIKDELTDNNQKTTSNQLRKFTKPKANEPANCLKMGSIDFVDLVSGDNIQESKKFSTISTIDSTRRVSIDSRKAKFSHGSQELSYLSILAPQGKPSESAKTEDSASLLFGSSSFSDDDLDHALAKLADPLLRNTPATLDKSTSRTDRSFRSSPFNISAVSTSLPVTEVRNAHNRGFTSTTIASSKQVQQATALTHARFTVIALELFSGCLESIGYWCGIRLQTTK
ncbi:Sec63 Brl domain-containing protein [Kalaharituber pfeilii]|nr:Sec63 Brl domain-containing protein [Kalaharituber pfeilii]